MTEWVGTTLSKVRLEKLLGRGGMAEVYLGVHTTLNRPVAVKVLHAHLSDDPGLLQRFHTEAQSVAALRHPNIVQVYDFDVYNERPYIVMELLTGESLSSFLERIHAQNQRLPLDTIARLADGLGAALDYAHERGIVHRDIKPANVMLRVAGQKPLTGNVLPDDAEPILTDFGIARIATATTRTATGTIMGTPAYMSPEQVRGETVDKRSDIYSLGIMIYEMVAGTPPFNADTDTPASVMYKQIHESPPPLKGAAPDLAKVIARSLAKEPGARYQHAGEMSADFRAAAEGKALALQPTIQPSQVSRPAVGEPAIEDDTGTARRPWTLFAGVGALGLLGLTAVICVGVLLATGGLGDLLSGQGPAAATATSEGLIVENPTETTAETPLDTAPPAITEEVQAGIPVGTASFNGPALEASLAVAEAAPPGFNYHAWLTSEDGPPLSLGPIEVNDGILRFNHVDTDRRNLIGPYIGLAISLEPDPDPNPSLSGEVLFEAAIAPEVLEPIRHLEEVSRGAPTNEALVSGILPQAEQFNNHRGFAVDALNGGSLSGGRLHAEHVINIAEGSNSQLFSDWNNDGRPENPGDDFGLIPYLQLLLAMIDADSSDQAAALSSQIEDVLRSTEEGARLAQRIASADTIDEAQPIGQELAAVNILPTLQELVETAGALVLSIRVEVLTAGP